MEKDKNANVGRKKREHIKTKMSSAARKVDGHKRQIAIYILITLLIFSAAGTYSFSIQGRRVYNSLLPAGNFF